MAPPSQLSDYSRLEQTLFAPVSVRSLHALVVGAGALGNEVVKDLGLLGVGAITIVDPDFVEPSNLTRSIFLRHAAPGAGKAVSLAASAAALFPDTRCNALAAEIADVGFGLVSEAHLLFGCVDSDLARLQLPPSSPPPCRPPRLRRRPRHPQLLPWPRELFPRPRRRLLWLHFIPPQTRRVADL